MFDALSIAAAQQPGPLKLGAEFVAEHAGDADKYDEDEDHK